MLLAAVTAYATVYLISSTVAATSRRRPQLQMLRQIGASGGQVGLVMTIEGALVAATGIVLGTLVALATLLPFDREIGAQGLPAGSPLIYLAIIALAAELTVVVTRPVCTAAAYRPSQV